MSAPVMNFVVEGETDAAILRAVLPVELLKGINFKSGLGRISAVSVGRNLLIDEAVPLLVIMDADSLTPRRVNETRGMAELALRNVAPDGEFKVFLFVPEIEVVFFEVPDALPDAFGIKAPAEAIREGLLAPKQTLERLLGESNGKTYGPSLISALNPALAQRFQASKQIKLLVEAVASLRKPAYSKA